MAGETPAESVILLVVVAIPASNRRGAGGQRIVPGVATLALNHPRRRRDELRARPGRSVLESGRRGEARHGVSAGAGEDGRKARVVLGRRRGLGLVTAKADFLLHLGQLAGLASVFLIESLHLKLETAALLADPLVLQFLLLNLIRIISHSSPIP